MSTLSQRVTITLLSPALFACVSMPTEIPPKHYVASVGTSSTVEVSRAEEGMNVLDLRASTVLRPGITVAFFPPDRCRNIAAASTSGTPEAVELQNDCGVLLSALETSVADRYSVVSWQTIKGPDPFARAAERNVTVIFEVDSFGEGESGTTASENLRIDFYEQSNATDRTPLYLGPEELPTVAARCKTEVEQIAAGTDASMVVSFTGAIKAVEVSSGQALLYYRRTLTDEPDSAANEGYDLYFRPTATVQQTTTYNGFQQLGVALGFLGLGAAVIGGTLRILENGEDLDGDGKRVYPQPQTAIAGGVFLSGLFVAGGGFTLLGIGNSRAKRKPPKPAAASYQKAVEVLCMQPTVPPWMQTATAPAPAGVGGNSVSFSETRSTGKDLVRERQNRLRSLVIGDFTRELENLGNSGTE